DVIRGVATRELHTLVRTIGAAVLSTMDARGVFPELDSRWAGVFLGLFNPNVIESRVFQQAGAVILVGVDAMMTHGSWKLDVPTCELTVQNDYSTLTAPAVRVNGDLKSVLARLSTESKPGFSEGEIESLRAGILPYFKRPSEARFAAQDIIEIMRELLP